MTRFLVMPADSPSPAEPADQYMSSGGVAKEFGVSSDTVARWAVEGRLPYFKTLGGRLRFRREDIDRLKAQEQVA